MFNLKNIHGRKILTGVDSNGVKWNQFELDYHNDSYRELCMEWSSVIEFGWECSELPEMKVCDNDITYPSKRSYYLPSEAASSLWQL